MEREKLQRIADYIQRHPQKFVMRQWEKPSLFGCKRCIAGLAIHFYGSGNYWTRVFSDTQYLKEAADILGLSYIEANQLFLLNYWPYDLCLKFEVSDSYEEHAALAVERIRRFLDGEIERDWLIQLAHLEKVPEEEEICVG